MGAVVCVQLGGLTDTIKGFYKIRKAYITLDGIMQMEQRYLQDRVAASTVASSSVSTESTDQPKAGPDIQCSRSSGDSEVKASTPSSSKHSPPEFQLVPDEIEAPERQTPHSSDEKLPTEDKDPVQKITGKLPKLSVSTGDLGSQSDAPSSAPRQDVENPVNLSNDPDLAIFSHPIDAYIHSGANLCFGVLLLVISMAPPTFSKLLSIIGFRGDKELGLRMLWQASKFHNMNGALAALAVLGYYNAFVRFCDIVPDDRGKEGDVEGYPVARLTSLLSDVRARYPTSQLWLLEESRMHSANRRLDRGLQLLSGGNKSPLKQIQMLHSFEKSLNAMYMHEYELCAQSFLEVSKSRSLKFSYCYKCSSTMLLVRRPRFWHSSFILLYCCIHTSCSLSKAYPELPGCRTKTCRQGSQILSPGAATRWQKEDTRSSAPIRYLCITKNCEMGVSSQGMECRFRRCGWRRPS